MNFESIATFLLSLNIALLIALRIQGKKHDEAIAALREQLQARVQAEARGLFNQLEAYLSLRDRLSLHRGLPYTANWSAAPDFLKLIVDHALTAKPATIVECGSGITTLMLARCCELNGRGHLFSLENGKEFAAKTRAEVERYGFGKHTTVLDAPLMPRTIDGQDYYQWYALEGLPAGGIDMLVIDGPPGFIQRHSRYPALPLLFERLADDCMVFLDDAARPDEREVVEWWKSAYPAIEHHYLRTERGCSVLRIRRAAPAG